MTLDPEFNAVKIEKVDLKVGYNPVDKTINIGTQNINNYHIVVNLPQNIRGSDSEIEKRINEVGNTVKTYFIQHPQELKELGSTVFLALVNGTGLATHSNITFIAMGTGSIKI